MPFLPHLSYRKRLTHHVTQMGRQYRKSDWAHARPVADDVTPRDSAAQEKSPLPAPWLQRACPRLHTSPSELSPAPQLHHGTRPARNSGERDGRTGRQGGETLAARTGGNTP